METVLLAKVKPVHLRRSLALQAFGNFDPTASWMDQDGEIFRKTFFRTSGICTVNLGCVKGGVEVSTQGDDASAVAEEMRASLESRDESGDFAPDNEIVLGLHRHLAGLRIFRVPWLFDMACSAILQQRIKSTDAMRDWKSIAMRFGTKSTSGHVAFPSTNALCSVPLHSLQALGIDPRRARTLLSCAKEIKLYPLRSSMTLEQIRLRLSRISGIGPWTLEMILGFRRRRLRRATDRRPVPAASGRFCIGGRAKGNG